MSSPKKLWRWFILAVVVSVKLLTCQGNRDNPVDIVLTDQGAKNIVKLRVDGMDVRQTTLFSSINPVDIVYDDVENRLYWIERSPNRIRSSDVDGRNVRLVTDLPSSGHPTGLAVGLKARKLFYTFWNRDVITSMDITGENVNTILNKTQVDYPLSITVHERKGIIIWSDQKTGYKISSSNFDGSDIKRIVDVRTFVRGMAVDERGDVLYWSEISTSRIRSVFLDGTNRRVLYDHSNILYDIVLLGNTLYFTAKNDRVHRMLINGSNVEEIQSTSKFIWLNGLVVFASKTLDVTTPDVTAPDVPARSSMIIALAIAIPACLLLLGVLVGIFIFWRLKHRRSESNVNHIYDGLRYDAEYQELIRVRGTPPQAPDIPDVSDPYYLTPRPPPEDEGASNHYYETPVEHPEDESDTEHLYETPVEPQEDEGGSNHSYETPVEPPEDIPDVSDPYYLTPRPPPEDEGDTGHK